MKVDVWMPLYVADLVADTLHLNRADFGSYVLLMCAYWRNKAPLPDDDTVLCTIARVAQSEWSASRSALAQHFQIEGGKWRHKRIDRELAEAIRLAEAKKRGADAANRAKRAKRTQSERTIPAERDAERAHSAAQNVKESFILRDAVQVPKQT